MALPSGVNQEEEGTGLDVKSVYEEVRQVQADSYLARK